MGSFEAYTSRVRWAWTTTSGKPHTLNIITLWSFFAFEQKVTQITSWVVYIKNANSKTIMRLSARLKIK